MQPLIVLNVVGLTPRHLGPLTPRLSAFAQRGGMREMQTTFPAVTCTTQASFMTGLPPDQTGIVANGWLFRDLQEIWFWRQSNRLVKGEKIWEAGKARNPQFTCANLFWWYNMTSDHDFGATPRPIYKADGRKLPDCFTVPTDWREKLTARLGKFPLFNFWGPNTTIHSSRWIAKAAELAITDFDPTLTLVYLPHLDYDLQRFGPKDPRSDAARRDVDTLVGDLADFLEARGVDVVIVSEYAITAVDRAVPLNKVLRDHDWLELKPEDGSETLDVFNSKAFAVVDHQVAHVVVLDAAPRHLRGGNSRHTRNLRCAHAAPTDVLTESYGEDELMADLLRVNGGETDEGPVEDDRPDGGDHQGPRRLDHDEGGALQQRATAGHLRRPP